jgi:GNAT superfamily N-acetyltransferase
MKLMCCRTCGDVVAMSRQQRSCKCGEAAGRYVDDSLVVQTEGTLSIALDNHGLRAAIAAFERAPEPWHPLMVFHAYLNPRSETDVRYVATSAEVAAAEAPAPRLPPVRVGLYEQDRADLRPLFRLADDSEAAIDSYLHEGVVFVLWIGAEVGGHLLLTEAGEPHAREVKSMAIVEPLQGRGFGRALVQAAIAHCQRLRGAASAGSGDDVRTLLVATAAAGVGQLRFYQRLGFRMLRVEREAFGPHSGYPADLAVNGIPLRDRVWLSMDVPAEEIPAASEPGRSEA